jgi:uncharacterized protein YjbI with pentapeptide repeats
MANPEHVEILRQGVGVWNKWINNNPTIIPDLTHAELSGADLSNAFLEGANLSGAILIKADLSKALLRKANLSAANLSEANLSGANLFKADFSLTTFDRNNVTFKILYTTILSGANLSGAILNEACIYRAYLPKANLSGSNLSNANLTGSNLSEADLSRANLSEAIFFQTRLDRANFSGANLQNAILNNVSLTEANFDQTILGRTSITGSNLQEALSLNKIQHNGPSNIDVTTIFQPEGKIQENFLRGCGIPENLIKFIKSLDSNSIEYYSCFISYSHQDKSFARRLHDQLQTRGIRCWLDEKQMLPGDDIYEQVDRGIRLWDKVLLCCSQHSLTSWWVDNEVATAFNKEQQLMKDRKKKVLSLIPLNLDGYMFSDDWTSGKRQQIMERLAADFTGWETDNAKFEEQFDRIVLALKTEGGREEAPLSRL